MCCYGGGPDSAGRRRDYVIRASEAAMANMPEIVQKMHTESGLLPRSPMGSAWLRLGKVLDYVRSHVPTTRKAPVRIEHLCRPGFLAKYMPDLDAYLHYRVVDVSSIKELVRRWYPKSYYASPPRPATTGPWATRSIRSRKWRTTGTR